MKTSNHPPKSYCLFCGSPLSHYREYCDEFCRRDYEEGLRDEVLRNLRDSQ